MKLSKFQSLAVIALVLSTVIIASAEGSPVPIAQRPAVHDQGYIGLGFTYETQNEKAGNFVIVNVVDGGPAQAAGIKKGDVIETIDGLICVVPDWDREPINPFKWVEAGELLKLTVRRGPTIVPIDIKTTSRPYPMGDTEALMRVKAKSSRGDKVFDELAARGAEVQATRSEDGKLALQCEGLSPYDLDALASGLDGRLGFDLGFRLERGNSVNLRLGLHPQKGFPSLLEVIPIPAPRAPAVRGRNGG